MDSTPPLSGLFSFSWLTAASFPLFLFFEAEELAFSFPKNYPDPPPPPPTPPKMKKLVPRSMKAPKPIHRSMRPDLFPPKGYSRDLLLMISFYPPTLFRFSFIERLTFSSEPLSEDFPGPFPFLPPLTESRTSNGG